MGKYKEIQELHKFCLEKGIKHEFSKLYDGYKILFYNGEDCVQHKGICLTKADSGIIEFWIRDEEEIRRLTLEKAKKFVIERYYL